MNLTLVSAITAFVVWIVVVFVLRVPSGFPHLLLAAAVMLLARRVLVGARRFRS